MNVFVNITLDRQDETDLRSFEEAVRKIPEVMECYLMTGDYDYVVRVVVADTADFERCTASISPACPASHAFIPASRCAPVQKSRELPIR